MSSQAAAKQQPSNREAATKQQPSSLERCFETAWLRLAPADAPAYCTEYRFSKQRRWRADVAFVDHRLLVELEGGAHTNGRHVRGAGYAADCQKYNHAVCLGWRVVRFTADMLRTDPASCIAVVLDALGWC